MGPTMTAFNVVKFKLKAGQEDAFLAAHAGDKANWPGLVRGSIIKTGERSYSLSVSGPGSKPSGPHGSR